MSRRGWLGQPLLHFLLLGALLFAGKQWLPVSLADTELHTIRVGVGDLQRLRREWQRETGQAPNAAELQASVARLVDEELLLREALRLGLDAADPVARERLLNNMRFAFPDTQAPDSELLATARALGMPSRDLVTRRRLVQVMEMRFVAAVRIDEAVLRDYVASHPERYAQPTRYAFRQVFFAAGRADAEQTARAQLAALRSKSIRQPGGDPFLLGEEFGPQPLARIERSFGAAFAQALARAKPGRWMGPLASPYGLHLVRLEQIEPGTAEDFERVRERAAYALLAEQEKTLRREQLARLRKNYRVEMPGGTLVSLHSGAQVNAQGPP